MQASITYSYESVSHCYESGKPLHADLAGRCGKADLDRAPQH